jgi:hypothetical protein
MNPRAKGSPEEQAVSEVVRAAMLVVDEMAAEIAAGHWTEKKTTAESRLERAVVELRLHRIQQTRASRVGMRRAGNR